MNRVVFQGVEGEIDRSEFLKTDPVILSEAHPCGVEGPASRALLTRRKSEDPKLREECGVVAVHGHPDAARQVYLGLYALQHRGQESAGIASADGQHLANIKGMGLVSEIFTEDVLAKLPGHLAIGPTRYSTPGDSALL